MKKIALIIIDMQNDFILPGSPAYVKNAEKTITKIKEVLQFFREKNLPIFHIIREYFKDGSNVENFRVKDFKNGKSYVVKGTKGAEIVKELKPIDNEYVIVKPRFSAFMKTELDFILRRLNVKTLVVCGTQYPNCIRTTVFDAVSYDYNVILLIDATSAQTEEIANANIIDIKNIGVNCLTVNEFKRLFKKN